jgi:CBS domain-containing protein
MGTTHIAVADAGPTVGEVMLPSPEVFGADMTVGDARREFESPRQKLVVVAEGDRYLGAADRDALEGADDDALVVELRASVPTLLPSEPTERIFELGRTRIPVVAEGRLLGLVCFNSGKNAFCVS